MSISAVGSGARELARRHPAGFTLLFARPAVTADAVGVVDLDLPDAAHPGHARLAATLGRPVDWKHDYESDIEDLIALVRQVATARG